MTQTKYLKPPDIIRRKAHSKQQNEEKRHKKTNALKLTYTL